MIHPLYKRLIRPLHFWLWLRFLHSAASAPPQSWLHRAWGAFTPSFDEDEL